MSPLLLHELNKIKEHIIVSAKENYRRDGHLAPCALVIDAYLQINPFVAHHTTNADKLIFVDKIKSICIEQKAIAVAFISEAYEKKMNNAEYDEYKKGDLETDKQAKEIVIISFETALTSEAITFDMDKRTRQLINETRNKIKEGDFKNVLQQLN